MRFEYAASDEPYDDVGGGRVLHSAPGFPGFPPRLAVELFERARRLTGRSRVGLWDPMCGAGGIVAAVGLLRPDALTEVLASDLDDAALELAAKNLRLLAPDGLRDRRRQLVERGAARDRVAAVDRLLEGIARSEPPHARLELVDVTDADAVAALDLVGIDVVLADLPYGRQTAWASDSASPPLEALIVLSRALHPGAVVVFSTTDREQLRGLPPATRSFKHGHRHIRLFRVGAD